MEVSERPKCRIDCVRPAVEEIDCVRYDRDEGGAVEEGPA